MVGICLKKCAKFAPFPMKTEILAPSTKEVLLPYLRSALPYAYQQSYIKRKNPKNPPFYNRSCASILCNAKTDFSNYTTHCNDSYNDLSRLYSVQCIKIIIFEVTPNNLQIIILLLYQDLQCKLAFFMYIEANNI